MSKPEGRQEARASKDDVRATRVNEAPEVEPSAAPPRDRLRGPIAAGLTGALVALAIAALVAGPRLFGSVQEPASAALVAEVEALSGELARLREEAAGQSAEQDGSIASLQQAMDELAGRSALDPSAALQDMSGQISALDERGAALAARLEAAEAVLTRLDDLAGRIGSLEQAIESGAGAGMAGIDDLIARMERLESAPSGGSGDAVAALRPRLETIEQRIAAVEDRQPAELAPLTEAVDELRDDVAALSDSLSALDQSDRMAALSATVEAADARALRAAENAAAVAPAIAALSLADALAAGRPFTAELAAARAHGAAAADLEMIAPYAESGLPTLPALAASFGELAPSLSADQPEPAAVGTIDRLYRSARDLVEVRPVGPLSGDDPFAIVSRISAALRAGDLAGALAEWESLPEEQKELSADWAAQAQARRAGDRLAEEMRNAAVSRLAAGAGQ